MATRPWSSSYESQPPGSQDISFGDDRIREVKVDTRERGEREHSWGPDEFANHEGDHFQGSAVAFFQSSAPSNRNNAADGLPATGNSGPSIGAEDDGRLWVLDSGGQYQLLAYDDSATSHGTYGKWRPVGNIDPSTMYDSATSSVTSAVTGTSQNDTAIRIEETAGNDLVASVTVPDRGVWMIEATATIVRTILDPGSGSLTPLTPVGIQVSIPSVPSTDNHWLGSGIGPTEEPLIFTVTLRIDAATNGVQYDFYAIFAKFLASGSDLRYGSIASSNFSPTYHSSIEAIIKPFGI